MFYELLLRYTCFLTEHKSNTTSLTNLVRNKLKITPCKIPFQIPFVVNIERQLENL